MRTNKTISNVFILFTCVLFLSACDENIVKNLGMNQNGTLRPEGTSDGAGGNGINFKMLESYKVEPAELPAAKKLLKKIIEKNEVTNDEENSFNFEELFVLKNWYIAPITLKTIPKDVLGISMTDDKHQQIAIQTKEAIWIDQNYFDKMDEKEQATLLVHEAVMGLYLLRFLNLDSYLKLTSKINPQNALSDEDRAIFEKFFAFETPRNLVSSDYETIREATAWIMNNIKTIDKPSIYKKLKDRGFLSFIRSDRGNTTLPKEIQNTKIPMTLAQVNWLITSSKAMNIFSDLCQANGQPVKCKVETELNEDQSKLTIKV